MENNLMIQEINDILIKNGKASPTIIEYLNEPYQKLYHYTNIRAFTEIVKSSNLWLSNARFLNDSKEIEEGKEKTMQALKSLKDKKEITDSDLRSLRRQINNLKYDYYEASFSKRDDLLNQWICYSQQGKGVCIEFDLNKNEYFEKMILNGLIIKSVLYKDEIKEEMAKVFYKAVSFAKFDIDTPNWLSAMSDITALVGLPALFLAPGIGQLLAGSSYLLEKIDKKKKNDSKELQNQMLQKMKDLGINCNANKMNILMNLLNPYFPLFKHHSFENEEEIRLIYLYPISKGISEKKNRETSPKLNYRVSDNNVIVPYITTKDIIRNDQMRLPISRIILGPGANNDCIKASIRFFLDQNGYSDIPIDISGLSYR